MLSDCFKKVVKGHDLSEDEAYACIREMIGDESNDILMAGFLTALAIKGETVPEITGFVKGMRQAAVPLKIKVSPLTDSCGTGGDVLKTFNVSTAAGIIAAACGVKMAKHGNRSITSKCGGADILEALGVNIEADKATVERCIHKVGFGFMYAPLFHPAMRRFMPIREGLGIRTIFNIIGPLISPVNAEIHLLGVFHPDYVEIVAEVLRNLKVSRAMVVHGYDAQGNPAMDEISILGKTKVALVWGDELSVQEIYPEDLGVKRAEKSDIMAAESREENIRIIRAVLSGCKDTAQDEARLNLCLINSAALLYLAGKVDNIKEGVTLAGEVIYSGKALEKLNELIMVSNQAPAINSMTK